MRVPRTHDKRYYVCPYCGKSPRVRVWEFDDDKRLSAMNAYCTGGIFKKHEEFSCGLIIVGDPYYYQRKLIDNWNKKVVERLKK